MPRQGSEFERPRLAGVHYSIIQALHWALLAIYFAFGAAYLYDIGLSSFTMGLVLAAVGLLSAVLQPLIAGNADRAARAGAVRRWCCILIIPSCGLMLALWLFTWPQWLHIGLFVLLWMLMLSLMFLFNSLAMEYTNAGYALNFGIGRALGSITFALGSYLYGRCVASYGTPSLLPIGFGLSCLLLIALLLWRSPPLMQAALPAEEDSRGFARRYPRFICLVISATICLTPYSLVANFLVRIVEGVGGSSIELGTAIMITALLEAPTMFLSVWLSRRLGSHVLMIVAAISLSVKMLMFTLANSVAGVYIAELFQLLSYPLLLCASVYYVNALMAPKDRVRGQAMMTLVQTVSSATGALLGGFLLDRFGMSATLKVALIVSIIGSALMVVFTQRVKSAPKISAQSDL
jgi:PPP family 3-phenylpropionic acid transporter